MTGITANMISAGEALLWLEEGNRGFREGGVVREGDDARSRKRYRSELRGALLGGQRPFAVVLGCSDSRVPVEAVFGRGLGELFVVRVAGNVAGGAQTASIEFAVQQFGSRLVVVLGHSGCGAVRAALESEQDEQEGKSGRRGGNARGGEATDAGDMEPILGRIRPAVAGLMKGNSVEDCIDEAVRANVLAAVEDLKRSKVIARLMREEGLRVVGAEYSLESGLVEFFEK